MNVTGSSSLCVLIDVSSRLGLSINLLLLQQQSSNSAASSLSFRDTASSVALFVEPVGATQPCFYCCCHRCIEQRSNDDILGYKVESSVNNGEESIKLVYTAPKMIA